MSNEQGFPHVLCALQVFSELVRKNEAENTADEVTLIALKVTLKCQLSYVTMEIHYGI